MSTEAASSGRHRLWLSSAISLCLVVAAVWVVRKELDTVHLADLRAALGAMSPAQVGLALLLTLLNYLVLTGYDQLAFRYIGKRVAWWRVTVAAFTGYALANSIGMALVAGASARYRFYSRWGVGTKDLSRIVVFYSATCWLGIVTLGGWSLLFHPIGASHGWLVRLGAQALGCALLMGTGLYLRFCASTPAPIDFGAMEVAVPSLGVAVGQVLLSMADWCLAAGILHTLLPASDLSYGMVVAAFVGAQVVGMASHVPGGLGVFEGSMVFLLHEHLPDAPLLSALVLFRLLYYFLPLPFALLILLADELRQRLKVPVTTPCVPGRDLPS